MKKSLLFGIALGVGFAASAQNLNPSNLQVIPSQLKNKTVPTSTVKNYTGNEVVPFSNVYNTTNRINPNPTPLAITTLGTTGYQLQTNRSNRNGLVKNSDGTISAIWIFSTTTSGWADRGTGYAYYNGTTWSSAPTVRVETVRTGWGEIAVTSSNKEHVIAHSPPNLAYSNRPVKGTGVWTETTIPSAITQGNLWPRMTSGGANGTSLHSISLSAPTANSGAVFQGQDGALTYQRSTDDGVTWSTPIIPTQHDSAAGYNGFGGDSYSIDSRGDVVAYTYGDFTTDWFLMKSTDNGATWTKTIIKDFPYANYTNQLTDTDTDGNIDTLWVSDGSVDVVIDNNNMCHVFSGRQRFVNGDTTTTGSYFPVTDGMYYWNENMVPGHPALITGVEDINGDQVLNLPTPQTTSDAPFGAYQTGMVTHPSAGIDGNNRIILVYSSVIEGTDNGTGHAYRNLYIMGSANGGNTWTTPLRFESDDYAEQVYCDMAPHNIGTTCVPVAWQQDLAIGTGFLTTQPDPQSGVADYDYECVSLSAIFTGINEQENNLFSVGNAFPNPFSGSTQLNITLNKASNVTTQIVNTLGQQVGETSSSNMSSGVHTILVDGSKLTSGVYFYTVRAGAFSVTKKLIIE
jgi:hypothetical protein